MWKEEENKLKKSNRKWIEHDYRRAELFCIECGKSVGVYDMVVTNPQTYVYCEECVKPYIKEVPYNLSEGIDVVFDNGNTVEIKYTGGYYSEIIVNKICYFNKKGRYIKVRGKSYYLNKS